MTDKFKENCYKCKKPVGNYVWTLTRKENNQTEYWCKDCFEEKKKTCLKEYNNAIYGNGKTEPIKTDDNKSGEVGNAGGGQGTDYWHTCFTDEKGNCGKHPTAKHSTISGNSNANNSQPNNKHYRFCFNCDKWKSKSEINEIDAGEQPGGVSGKTWNCDTCRKDLGETCQIFRCPKHSNEILKVWGTMDGQNQEKVFYKQCPQDKKAVIQPIPTKPEQPPKKGVSRGTIAFIIIAILATIGGGIAWMLWNDKKKKQREIEEMGI